MSGYSWGGSEELWSRAALRLCESSHDIAASVEFSPQLSTEVTRLAECGVRLWVRERLPPPRLPMRVWRRITRRRAREYEWLQPQNPSLVIISQGANSDGLPWMKLCLEQGLRFVAIVQCNSEHWWPMDEPGAELAQAYRAAQKVFCVSRHNLDLLECQIGEPLPNAVIVWNPYNVSPNEPPPWPQGNICKLACVARLEPAAKGQDVLLKALAQPQWRNRAAELNLYGAGPFEHSLRQLVERLQLRNVHFRGHIADVNAIWEQNHILVLPSRLEGLPLSLVEAMFCARPAIVTDVGGNAELCVDGETGFVAAAPALSLLEQTLERAWNHRDEWQRMGMAARELVQRVVPKDPVGDFCGEILKCASSGQTAAVCEQRSSNLSTE